MPLTVIIASCNRPDRLLRALQAIGKAVATDGEMHNVVVVDNGPDQSARDVTETFAKTAGFTVHYRLAEPYNKAAALNDGISAADTEWLAFTDDDCLPDERWLASAGTYMAQCEVNLFSGQIKHVPPEFPLPCWLDNDALPWSPAFVDYAPLPQSGVMDEKERVPFGANIFVKKSVYEQYGGYDEDLWNRCGRAALGSEDAEFAIRVREHGEKVGYCAEAIVEHPVFRERVTKQYYLRHIYNSGMREPHFADEGTRAPYAYLARNMIASLLKSAGSGLAGTPTRAMYHLMEAARDAGEIRGWQTCASST